MWGSRLAFTPNRGENWRMRNDDVPGLIRKFLPPVRRRAGAARSATLACALLAAFPAATLAQGPQGAATFPVGIRELDYVDPHEDGRHLTLRVFYPAAMRERSATPFVLPFFTQLNLYKDAEAADSEKRPLVVFSHGRGSNGLYYGLVRRVSGFARLHRGGAQPLPRQHLRLNHRLSREQALATPRATSPSASASY